MLELHSVGSSGDEAEIKALAFSDSQCTTSMPISPVHIPEMKFTPGGCTKINNFGGKCIKILIHFDVNTIYLIVFLHNTIISLQ